jgi:acetyl esterase/lipase
MTTNASIDPMLRVSWSKWCAAQYLSGRRPDDPACSPLFADLRGLPPMLIQVGSDEILLDDSTRLAARCKNAGVDTTPRVFQGMWHEFQIHAGMLREADEAVAEIGGFLKDKLGSGPASPKGFA